MTELVDMSGKENEIKDSWDDDNWNCKCVGKEWTGKTICHILPEIRKKTQRVTSATMASTAFLVALMSMATRMPRRKQLARVFDFNFNKRLPEVQA